MPPAGAPRVFLFALADPCAVSIACRLAAVLVRSAAIAATTAFSSTVDELGSGALRMGLISSEGRLSAR